MHCLRGGVRSEGGGPGGANQQRGSRGIWRLECGGWWPMRGHGEASVELRLVR